MLGGGVRFFPIQSICHWRGYKCSRSAFIFAMYFHCMGVYCRLSIRCTVELWIFRLRLLRPLRTLRLLCRFWLVVASPLMLSVFHSVSLTVAFIFPWWKLLPPSGSSSVEWYHRWSPQSPLVALFHLLHFHILNALLPDSDDSYGQHNPCWSIRFAFAHIWYISGRASQFTKACPKSVLSWNVYRAWCNSSILLDAIFGRSNCFTDLLTWLNYATVCCFVSHGASR